MIAAAAAAAAVILPILHVSPASNFYKRRNRADASHI